MSILNGIGADRGDFRRIEKYLLGWVIYEEVGIVVVNDYAIAKIEVTAGT